MYGEQQLTIRAKRERTRNDREEVRKCTQKKWKTNCISLKCIVALKEYTISRCDHRKTKWKLCNILASRLLDIARRDRMPSIWRSLPFVFAFISMPWLYHINWNCTVAMCVRVCCVCSSILVFNALYQMPKNEKCAYTKISHRNTVTFFICLFFRSMHLHSMSIS